MASSARFTIPMAAIGLALAALCGAADQPPETQEDARRVVAQLVAAVNARDMEALRKVVTDKDFLSDMERDFRRAQERRAEARVANVPEGLLAACPSSWTEVRDGRERTKENLIRITIARGEQGLRIVKLELDENLRMRQATLLGRRLEQACVKKDLAELTRVLNLNEAEAKALQAGDEAGAKRLGLDWLLDPLAGRAAIKETGASRKGKDAVSHVEIKTGDAPTRKDLTVKVRPGELGKESYYLDWERPAEPKP